ncbi:hypothetical protein KP77_33230 [Jeotgalibacillus alimentarius]|uniref:Uncharacterized protein n=1 Tax=Jeotgalibacillus alimentarius TaxID=135826 RepID=A0A0C2V3K9_9BACL|nr:hypothetical protein [Jeotgalibacillus alimentarius]KIL43617.1 hypothetical protein KP77_33230 [Jeotgalibacillus alimentarius]
MKKEELRQLEIEISDLIGKSYRTIVNFEKSHVLRTSVINDEKIDFKPVMMNEEERERVREKLLHLNISTLKNRTAIEIDQACLHWQVVMTTDREIFREIGIDQLPDEWGNVFRLLP